MKWMHGKGILLLIIDNRLVDNFPCLTIKSEIGGLIDFNQIDIENR